MNQQTFKSGAFVFTRARGVQARPPDEIEPLLKRHGIEPSLIPTYAGDRTAFGRAISQAKSGLAREGYLLRPIKRAGGEVVYGIVREQKDEARGRLDHDFKATVSWSLEPDSSHVYGEHPVARRVAEAYRMLRGKITADDWSGAITAHLESNDAARVRSDGRVYWVPPQRLDSIRRLGAFLEEVGIDLILCELEPEARTIVQDVARSSLDEQLIRLEAEVARFDGKQKPSTYARRLDEYQRLRDRASLYREALGVGVDRAITVLSELERKVTEMFELRTQTVIHRDDSATPPAAAEKTLPCLRFAGAIFTPGKGEGESGRLVFVSDDNQALAKVRALESMGLAGQWQDLGCAEVSIQNSGPPGARVTIGLRLRGGCGLMAAAPALSTIGIELC